MADRTVSPPKYLAKVLDKLATDGQPTAGGVVHVVVAHDNWCAIHRGGLCNCEPDVQVRKDQPK